MKKKGSVLAAIGTDQDVQTVYLGDFSVLGPLIDKAIAARTRHVFIEGGDGTAHGVLTCFMRKYDAFDAFPKFTILPGGMTNQVAKNIGLKRGSAPAVQAMIETGRGAQSPFPLLEIDIKGAERQYGFVFSTGGIPAATDYCTSKIHDKGLGGSLAVAATIARGVAGSKQIRDDMMPPTPLKLCVSGPKEEVHLNEDHLASLVTTLPGLILNIDPFWGEGDGALRLTYANAQARNMVKNLISIWMGNKAKDRKADGFESFNAQALRYIYDGPAVLDGERLDVPDGEIAIRASKPVTFVT